MGYTGAGELVALYTLLEPVVKQNFNLRLSVSAKKLFCSIEPIVTLFNVQLFASRTEQFVLASAHEM